MQRDKELEKRLEAYRMVSEHLKQYVDAMYPPGTKLRCNLTGDHYIVKERALDDGYDVSRIRTDMGYVDLAHIERVGP